MAFPEIEEFGAYRLQGKIAQGGMADVLLATSTKKELHGQFIAIKRLLPHLNSNKAFVDLLVHEAKVGVLLNHPGIASVYDLGSYKSEFFIAMEYVHGKSLDRILAKVRAKASPRLPVEVSTFVVLEILRALSFAHQLRDAKDRELNIIHRDISPGNILLGYKGEVKLVDFGIATAESRLQSGFAHSAMGKLAYMAPEQAVNDPVVKASDIYSLGVVMYELLTGQLPFQAENSNALLKKVIDGRMTDIKMVGPSIAQELRDIVSKCLDKAARKRFQSCPELFQSLVGHFKQALEIDFTARATREYYKKRLSEYLRLAFEAEIVQELGVVQRALKEAPKTEDLKATAPQMVSRGIRDNVDFDMTVIEPDLTEEATRHYPLTESERKKILQGIPPKDVFNQPTRASEKGGLSAFSLATVPEYVADEKGSKVQRISVKERLEKSSLKRDDKETLRDHMPALEITTNEELEAFEQNTFSGGKDIGAATSHMDRNQIFRDFEAIQQEVQKEKEGRRPVALELEIETPKPSAFKKPITTRPNDKSSPSSRSTWLSALLILVIFGAGGFLGVRYFDKINFYVFNPPLSLLPTQSVQVVMVGEASLDEMREFRNSLYNSGIQPKIEDLQHFFQSEYARYTGIAATPVRIEISEPSVLVKGISVQHDSTQLMNSSDIFEFLSPVSEKSDSSSAQIFLYLYSFDPESSANPNFPFGFTGRRPRGEGIVYSGSHSQRQFSTLFALAREICSVFGAEDTFDPTTNMPLIPRGLFEPKKFPVFPQDRADIMAREIAISPLQRAPVHSFQKIGIGPYTAYRLGWITREKMILLTD